MKLAPLLSCSLVALSLLGCTPGDESLTAADEACEHAASGPFVEVDAAAPEGTPPDISASHTAYQVRTADLLDDDGNRGGRVAYASGEEGEYAIFLSEHMDLAVFDAAGDEVALTGSVHEVAECAELSMFHTVALGVGTYELQLGPTALEEVLLLIEESAPAADDAQGQGG